MFPPRTSFNPSWPLVSSCSCSSSCLAGSLAQQATRGHDMIFRKKLKTGMIGGAIILYLSLIGMVESFENRFIITNVIGLGTTLILLALIGTGYLASKDEENPPVWSGFAAGISAGVFMSAWVLIFEGMMAAEIPVRDMFVAVTPQLLDILEFGGGLIIGPIILIAVGAVSYTH